MTTAFVHVRTERNVGDRWCCPADYYTFPDPKIYTTKQTIKAASAVIYGGGAIEKLIRQSRIKDESGAKHRIAWGIGTSDHGQTSHQPLSLKLDLVGAREYGRQGGTYVPCVSCMHPLFDMPYEIRHEAVMFVNADPTIKRPDIKGVPTLDNSASLDKVIAWIASGSVVITNSFHGAYWATLLKRRVICVAYSSKFYGYKHKPYMLGEGETWWSAATKAAIYDDALADCRNENNAFYDKVRNLLGF